MKKVQLNPISFSPVVRAWSREKFLRVCGPQFPDHDLESYADDMGLISEPVADEAPAATPPAAEGGEIAGMDQVDNPAEKPKGRRKKKPTE